MARSNESKAMGIKMGTPFFKIRDKVESGNLIVRSSNYSLYGDLSSRVMSILAAAVPKIEIYSIDEAYLCVDGIDKKKLEVLCPELVRRIRKWVGIPVSIGIASTKTLAKVANHFAKKYPGYKGVCRIVTEEQRVKALKLTPIGDVWGIGRRVAPRLLAMGLTTAYDYVSMPQDWVYKNLGLGGLRVWNELNGKESVDEERDEARQSICTSRSFAETITDIQELSARVSDFAAKCAEKLRHDGTAAYCINTFLYTNRFREDKPQDFPDATIRLDMPASSTQEVVSAALKALNLIWKPGFEYKKAGVVVFDIVNRDERQLTLFGLCQEGKAGCPLPSHGQCQCLFRPERAPGGHPASRPLRRRHPPRARLTPLLHRLGQHNRNTLIYYSSINICWRIYSRLSSTYL